MNIKRCFGKWDMVALDPFYGSGGMIAAFSVSATKARNFKRHGHDPRQCDLIVCWRHNWKNCPPNLQVLELSKVVEQLGTDRVIW
jgi:hypothetical protein